MNRNEAIEALRNDIIDACEELTFERLVVARNLVRALVEQQDDVHTRTVSHSDVVPRAAFFSPPLAKAPAQPATQPPEAIVKRKRVL